MEKIRKNETETGFTISLEDYVKLNIDEKKVFCCEFCYRSNLIEGIRTPYIETVTVGEIQEKKPELDDHYSAFNFMLENFNKVLEEKDIRKMHFLLMRNLLRNPEKNAGEYRKCKIWVGGKGGPHHGQIPRLMKNLESDIKIIETRQPHEDIWRIHNKFETIHPFVDGNGRTGRLILNWLSLKHLNEFNIIELPKRDKYYQTIRSYKEEFKKNNPKVRFYQDRKFKPMLYYF